ncbi:MAG: hypothetical protein AAGF25_02255 [Pseudomonadota bacterium]
MTIDEEKTVTFSTIVDQVEKGVLPEYLIHIGFKICPFSSFSVA